MMERTALLFSMLILFIGVGGFALASMPAPAPSCDIEGTIKAVEFREAYDEPCLTEEYGCPTDTEVEHPARYHLLIEIETVAYASGESRFMTCEEMLPLGAEKSITIDENKVRTGDVFRKGRTLTGRVSSFWGLSLESYDLGEQTGRGREAIAEIVLAILLMALIVVHFMQKDKKR